MTNNVVDVACQIEMDEYMTVRMLPIYLQGYPESYISYDSSDEKNLADENKF